MPQANSQESKKELANRSESKRMRRDVSMCFMPVGLQVAAVQSASISTAVLVMLHVEVRQWVSLNQYQK